MIELIGAKGKIKDVDDFLEKISIFAKENNVIIQTFDADLVFGKNHIFSAFEHAVRAIDRKTNTTNSLEKEILLYASGERQIKLAIPKIGVKLKNEKIVFIFINNEKTNVSKNIIKNFLDMLCLVRDDNVIKGDEKTLIRFGINKNEIKTVTKDKYADLILEKVAMVDIIK
jgi:KEOPS complex subunit Cgi121